MPPLKGKRPIADRFAHGVACFRQGDGMGAVEAFESVLDDDPGYRHTDGDNPYFYLGKIHEVEGRIEKAVLLYSRALTLDPWDEESLIGRGSCMTIQRKHRKAIADFEKALSIPDSLRNASAGDLLYAIAENFRQEEDFENALKWGKRALDADPDNARHQMMVKRLTGLLARNDPAR
ncbi:MAG: tetratricopeptide repeat protein [Desulfobacterales bacterium]|jgi:tetratricopeptide (TPR) repeat protein